MNFLSCVGVDIMGPKFKLIFVWPNLATQPKEHRVWIRGEGIRSSLFLSENIFFLVSSHLRHFFPECAWGAHSLSAAFFLGGDRSAYGILCVCFLVYLRRFRGGSRNSQHSTSSCTCVKVGAIAGEAGACIHAFVCCCLWPALFSVLLSWGHGPVQALRSFPVTG